MGKTNNQYELEHKDAEINLFEVFKLKGLQ